MAGRMCLKQFSSISPHGHGKYELLVYVERLVHEF